MIFKDDVNKIKFIIELTEFKEKIEFETVDQQVIFVMFDITDKHSYTEAKKIIQ